MYGSGKLVLRRKSIGHSYGHVTFFRQLQTESIEAFSTACSKTTAVDADHRRKRSGPFSRASHIELQMLIVWIRVLNVLLEQNAGGHRFLRANRRLNRERHENYGSHPSGKLQQSHYRNPCQLLCTC